MPINPIASTSQGEVQIPESAGMVEDNFSEFEKVETVNNQNPTKDYSDPNQIDVTIEDQETPIVVLFGPPNCGKTMTLIRMTRWLGFNGYTIEPIRTFRPTEDSAYQSMCDNFNMLVNQDESASSTSNISFMLLKIYKNGRPVCQILEAPGELYFDPKDPNKDFPRYINELRNRKVRKVWTFFVEPNWLNSSDRSNYVSRIKKSQSRIRTNDSAVILYNKIDKTPFEIKPGKVRMDAAMKQVADQYQGIFELFKNDMPIISMFKKYNCDFVPFQTGDYSRTNSGSTTYTEGPDEYCRLLWTAIMNGIRG